MKYYSLFAIILTLCSFVQWIECEELDCHMRKLDKCVYPGLYFTHPPGKTGIVPNRKEFELMCKVVRKCLKCVNNYFQECGTEGAIGIYGLLYEHIVNSLKELCKEGPMKENFLKWSHCIHGQVKSDKIYKQTCVNDLQAGLEYLTNLTTVNDWLDTGCCVYNIWEDCIVNMTLDKCGGGESAVYDLIDIASGRLIHVICNRDIFDSNSDWCKSKLPPPGTKAKGRFSKSAISKYFTFICPNTGWR